MSKTSKLLVPALALGMAFGANGVSAESETVTIEPGDTLKGIAQQHADVTLDKLYELNPEINPYNLEIGSEVKVSTNEEDSSREIFHTVEPGSTLLSIANLHAGVTLDDLYELNPGINPYDLEVGSEVRVNSGEENSDQSKPLYHTIQPNSTLYSIAQLYEGITINDLYELNPGINPYDLEIGSEIRVG